MEAESRPLARRCAKGLVVRRPIDRGRAGTRYERQISGQYPSSRPSAATASRRPRRAARRAAGMESCRSLSRHRCAGGGRAISPAPRPNAPRSRRPTRASSPKSPRPRGPAPSSAPRWPRFEKIEDLLGRLMSFAGLVHAGDTTDRQARQVLRRRAGQDHRGLDASPVLHAGAQPHRRCADREGARRAGASATTGPGSRTCAKRSPTSSRTASSSCSTKSRSPAAAPGTGCSTRPWRACASRSTARSSRSNRR